MPRACVLLSVCCVSVLLHVLNIDSNRTCLNYCRPTRIADGCYVRHTTRSEAHFYLPTALPQPAWRTRCDRRRPLTEGAPRFSATAATCVGLYRSYSDSRGRLSAADATRQARLLHLLSLRWLKGLELLRLLPCRTMLLRIAAPVLLLLEPTCCAAQSLRCGARLLRSGSRCRHIRRAHHRTALAEGYPT